MNLIYINELGPNYKGENIYEFIFTEDSNDEIWGENWDARPANGYPTPPDIEYVKKVGVLKNNEITLAVIQNSDYFCMADAIDGVIALGWENDDNEIDFGLNKRLVFRYGDDEQTVKDKLYERDIVLEFEKKVVYEK
jgi:hypothetical protein